MGTPADGLDQSPRYLITDELKLRQVLVNLQSNCSIMAAVPAALNSHDNR
jgi:C4-dicarboxylate-specific signal transduction histidine kinase